jgi:hypothetical protein
MSSWWPRRRPAADPRLVRSLVMTPMLDPEPVGALGAYWSHRGVPPAEAVDVLQRLAGLAGAALKRFPGGIPDPSFGARRTVSAA